MTFFSFEVYQFHTWENIFVLITQGGLALQHIQTW